MNQKEAVFSTTTAVLSDMGIEFHGDVTVVTDEARTAIIDILVEGFKEGKFSFEQNEANQAKLSNDSKLKAYVNGLVSNWFRKDKRLNGNVQYVAKNPGSRAGSTDPEIRELRKAMKAFAPGSEKYELCKAAIDERLHEIKASKPTTISIDTSVIDPELAAKLGL